jgi:phenylacetate-CoA ligase
VRRDQIVRVHASSGFTGCATAVGYTKGDLEIWSGLMARSLRATGVVPSDIVHLSYGYGLFTGGLGFHYGAEKLGCLVVPAAAGMTARKVTLIEDFGATPSYALTSLDEYRAQGRDPAKRKLRIGVFGGEPWTNSMRTEIEDAFNVQAHDFYGLSEMMGPGVGIECIETKDGLRLWEDHFLAEIIDPETGVVLPDGQVGELVLTSLTKEAMPIIRYPTRDLTRLLPGTARSKRRIKKIRGRSDYMIILLGVNVFPSQIEEQLLAVPGLAPDFQIELVRRGRMDQMVVHTESAAPLEGEGQAALSAALACRIRQSLGMMVEVIIGAPGAVPRSQGKAMRFVDRRPPN